MKKLAYIDALRGYAILGVLLVHAGQYCGFVEGTAFGARGVQLFFVASALTLTMSWRERADGAGAFFVRRLFRIAPMFWLTILVFLWSTDLRSIDWNQVAGTAAFLQGIRPDWIDAPIVGGGWSVSAEVMFYALFPLLMLTVTTGLRAAALLCAAIGIGLFWTRHGIALATAIFPGSTAHEIAVFWFMALPLHLPAFAAGIFAWFLIPTFKTLPRWITETILILALLAVAFYSATKVHNLTAFALLFCTIAVCLASGAGRYLVNPVIAQIGRVSFSAYLLQWRGFAIALAANQWLGLDGAAMLAFIFPAAVLITVTISSLTYRLIERPCVALGARALQTLRQTTAPAY